MINCDNIKQSYETKYGLIKSGYLFVENLILYVLIILFSKVRRKH